MDSLFILYLEAKHVYQCPEFLSRIFVNYCEIDNIKIKHILHDKPARTGHIERFNRNYREHLLDKYRLRNREDLNMKT